MDAAGKVKYVSFHAEDMLCEYIRQKGYEVRRVRPASEITGETAYHPDLVMCRLGISDDAPVISAEDDTRCCVRDGYPRDVFFNAACTGEFFIHNLKYTSPQLLKAAAGMKHINVRQGYTKCSVVIVDEKSIITYDKGIYRACRDHFSVLLVRPGFVRLRGYDTGFIGGASGRVGDEIVFNGDLSHHPDFDEICDFVDRRGLSCKWFDWELEDIGSII